MAASAREGAGPPESARALGASVLALLEARVELVAIELKEEAERRKRMLVLAFVAALFAAAGLMLAAIFVIFVFWDTWRLAATGGVTLLYLGICAWAVLRIREAVRDSPHPFSATLGEFRKDLDMLRGHHE